MLQKTDHMQYLNSMEVIDSNIMEKVLGFVNRYRYSRHAPSDVERALAKDSLSIEDFGALLSPAAEKYLEQMAGKSRLETQKHFGNSVSLFTPLYIANYCENYCIYCGFNCRNKIQRGRLTLEEINRELETIAKTGLKEILLLTGESRAKSGIEYIGEAIMLAKQFFSTIGIEIYPLNVSEYAYLQKCGADFVSVYQETYDADKYEQLHVSGPKRSYPYRFNAQERALMGGMRGVAFGALFGLGDFRKDAFATGIHACFIQQKYPHADVSFSVPRLRPYINNAENNPNDVNERQLLQIMLAYRLFMPYAEITISTRERSGFRDNVIGMAATKISAGVRVGVGGHDNEEKGDAQFQISDTRSVSEIHNMLISRNLQPVYTDYIRM